VKKNKRRRCSCCRQLFHCHPRTRAQQKYCSAPSCRTASKTASQRRWLGKPENQDYFCGPQHVNRVQAWREVHPDYGRKGAQKRRPLQETITRQPVDQSVKCAVLALQEMIPRQAADTVDPIGAWAASALQDAM
jgi:hypothetical protein